MSRRPIPMGWRAANDFAGPVGAAMFWLTGGLLTLALVFGGASRENLLLVSLLELAAIPVLAAAVWRLTLANGWRGLLAPVVILIVAAAVPLLQLIPVPFELWAKLPGHGAAATALRLAGLGDGWRAFSLAPIETWRSALALVPPAAVFLAAAALDGEQRRRLAIIIPVAAGVSLLIGLAQVAGGPDSPLYFYANTNNNSAVGLFANRNHQAALLVTALPFAALWIDLNPRRRIRVVLSLALAFSLFLIAIVGLITVRSRAGVLLMAPALAASVLLIRRGGLDPKVERRAVLAVGGLVLVALTLGLIFGRESLMERFGQMDDGRLSIAPYVAKAAAHFQPFGAGVGSFPQVFTGFEPIETMTQTFWNHAHDDYLEIWFDAGLAGLALVAAFLVWWGVKVRAVWRRSMRPDRLARAATVAAGLLIVHSLVDYPLRTLAMACVFAFACATMARGPAAAEAVSSGRRRSRPEPERPSLSEGSSRALPEGGRRRARSR